jgi:DNA mismatch endonuclease (patch repair protein)
LAVFIDGDYWHGRILIDHGEAALIDYFKRYNSEYWVPKILATAERDRLATLLLERAGWTVFRFWESDVRADLAAVALAITHQVRRVVKPITGPRRRPL